MKTNGVGGRVAIAHAALIPRLAGVLVMLALLAPVALAERTRLKPGMNLFTAQQDIEVGREVEKQAESKLQMLKDNRFAEDSGKRSIDPVRPCSFSGVVVPFPKLGSHGTGGFCLLQTGRNDPKSGCSSQGRSVCGSRSIEHPATEALVRFSCLPAFGGDPDQRRDWEPEADAKVPWALQCEHHGRYLHAYVRGNGARCRDFAGRYSAICSQLFPIWNWEQHCSESGKCSVLSSVP